MKKKSQDEQQRMRSAVTLGIRKHSVQAQGGHRANDALSRKGALQTCRERSENVLDYEPFGALLPGRNYSSDSYRFGFNGMRKDEEIHGATGTSYDFGARLYDPRVGKWLSLDPLASKYPLWSPYQFVDGNPVRTIDIDGRDIIVLNDREGARGTGHAAVLIGSDETGWTYISKDGASNGSGYGRSKFVIATFKTVAEFAMSQHNFSTLMILH